MKQFSVAVNVIIETSLTLDEFNVEFIKWMKSKNWSVCGSAYLVDEDGDKIGNKIFLESE